jgi:hypothetical protein
MKYRIEETRNYDESRFRIEKKFWFFWWPVDENVYHNLDHAQLMLKRYTHEEIIIHNPEENQSVYFLPKDVIDDIGKLVSIAACYDKETAKHYAEKLDKVLKTKEQK